MGERCGGVMGREGDCGERGFFVGGGVKKVFAKDGGSFGGEVWGVMGREGDIAGEGAFLGGVG